ncbi:hypothetical protein KR093_010037 [Drosophila rubida]|uniref:Uncharacterized protein n=1 Tax=Drosophila rubida TaxID=30044 RepID=A0AAD4K891_9MUSC|nr:hypothetical protein KR093_010037 [Drosophila rubida]
MLKWTASTQRLHELPPSQQPRGVVRRQRRQRRATIANKENVPSVGYTSTPMPLQRLRNSPLVLAPLSDIRNVTPESRSPARSAARSPQQPARLMVQSVRYAATLPRYEEEYSPSAQGALLSGQHLALRGLLPLDPFLEQPRYMVATQQLRKRKLEPDFVATLEPSQVAEPVAVAVAVAEEQPAKTKPLRPVTPQPASTQMGDQTLDRLIDAILDSACKSDPSSRKKPRKSFNLRRRTLVKQQLESQCHVAMLSPSYAAGDDPASDLSFALLPLPRTPEPASPLNPLPHSLLVQLPTPQPQPQSQWQPSAGSHSDTFCLATPVRPLKRSRAPERQTVASDSASAAESPLKRYKVDARNYFEVGLALPSSIYV